MRAPVQLTADLWAALERVNLAVNSYPYKADLARYQQPEFWALIDAQGGDCEDYALEKRRRLLADAWPLEALRLATCITETGEGHAVLTVDAVHPSAGPGTWVLDNRYLHVEPFDVLPYRWIERQASGRPEWVAIET